MTLYREVDTEATYQGWRFRESDRTDDIATWARTVVERVDADVVKVYRPDGHFHAYAGDVILRTGEGADSLTLAVNPYAWEEV